MSEAEVVPLAPRPDEAALGERERELRAALDLRDAGPVEFLDVLQVLKDSHIVFGPKSVLETNLRHGCQMAIAGFLVLIVCDWPFGLLDSGTATLRCKL